MLVNNYFYDNILNLNKQSAKNICCKLQYSFTLLRKMRTACVLYLIISNSFCLGYRLQDNELKKNYKLHLEKETNIKNTPVIKVKRIKHFVINHF